MTEKVSVGILHSLTGMFSISEKPLVNASMLAIEEINKDGGVLGKQLEAVIEDGASDYNTFTIKAEKLLLQDHVAAIFGCWSSFSRKAVKTVVEKHNGLLWYPLQYEGLEQSPNIIYTGECLNQQIEPAVLWALAGGKKKCLLIGSDYVFPHVANDMMKVIIEEQKAAMVGEIYLPLEAGDVSSAMAGIKALHPDVIFNTINGETNIAFFRCLAELGLRPDVCPVISFSFSETELHEVVKEAEGHYACWPYFNSFDTKENRAFIKKFANKFGESQPVSAPVVNAYTQVHLWRKIVESIGSFEPSEVARRAPGHSVSGLAGEMKILPNHHVRKYMYIGRAGSSGDFKTIWCSDEPIEPKPWLGLEDMAIPRENLLRKALGLYPDYVSISRDLEKQNYECKQAETALQQSESRYRLLVETMRDGIMVIDKDDHIVYVNPRMAEMLGYTPAEMRGKHPFDFLTERGIEIIKEQRKLRRRGISEKYDCEHKKKDGSIVHTTINVTAQIIEDGTESGSFAVIEDITQRRKMEETLKDSEIRYRAILDNIQGGVALVKGDWIVYANHRTTEILGYSIEEMSNMKPLAFVTSDVRPRMLKKALDWWKSPDPFVEMECWAERKDKEKRYLHIRLTRLSVKETALLVINDFTERKKAEEALRESEERYRGLFESANDLIQSVTTDGRFLYVNRAWRETFGYTQEEVAQLSYFDIIHPDGQEHCKKAFQQVLSLGHIDRVEANFVAKDGRKIVLEGNVSCKYIDEKPVATRGIFRDVTQRKIMEAELHKKVQELNDANEHLKEIDQLKDNFLSTVSHELRTPLTSIKSFSEILLNYDEDKATQKEFLGIINEESERLTRLINDFLDISKIQAGRVQWKTGVLSVAKAIQTAVTSSGSLITQGNLQLSIDIPPDLPDVLCDQDRLVQVMTNLLGNAIKFTPLGGTISIRGELVRGGDSAGEPDMVRVSISDTGIGIAPENFKRIFEKFGQVGDVLRDRPKGTGLGLPICKEIVEHYNGKIWVESKLGAGSTFYFTLPVAREKVFQVLSVINSEDAAASKNKTILVVDDEANIRRSLQHELAGRGHNVIEATGGREAIDLARKHRPDLITLDVMMPDLDGFEVTAILKSDPLTKDIPILMVSVVDDKDRANRLGVNDYIVKPFIIDSLIDKVNRLLSGSKKAILVVDDDKNLVKSIEYELKKHGFTSSAAYDGKEALELINKTRPALILLDVKMPVLDGYEVIKILKSRPETADIPIVVMTGVEAHDARVKSISMGVDEFIDKSGGYTRLFETMEKILGN